jgi:hypothetical protein
VNYLRAYTLGVAQVRKRGQHALDLTLIRKLHRQLMSGESRAAPLKFRTAVHTSASGGGSATHDRSLVESLKVTFPSANAAVAVLVDMDILRPQGQQRRNRAFHAHEVMNLLYTGIDAVLDDVATLRNYRHKGGA